MKKFIVLRQGLLFSATVVRGFDKSEQANKFACLLAASEEDTNVEYFVAEITYTAPKAV